MKLSDKLRLRESEIGSRLLEIAAIEGDARTDDVVAEETKLTEELASLKPRIRAAVRGEEAARESIPPGPEPVDTEGAEREALRQRARVGRYFAVAANGAPLDGVEAEANAAFPVASAVRSAVGEGGGLRVPFALFEGREPVRERADVVTQSPSTTGRIMESVTPGVFARATLPRLGVVLPRAESGVYVTTRLSTNLTGAAKAAGSDIEASAAGFTTLTAEPRRLSGRLAMRAEDLLKVGISTFEGSLVENLRLVIGDLVDTQGLRGSGTDPAVGGLASKLTAVSDPANIITFESFASGVAGHLDGLWSETLRDLRIAMHPQVLSKLESTFTGTASSPRDFSAADWARRAGVSLWASSRMSALASNIGKCIVGRVGGRVKPMGAETAPAVWPTYGDLAIRNVYSGDQSATEYFTVHVFMGSDVLVRQPDAFAEFRVKTA